MATYVVQFSDLCKFAGTYEVRWACFLFLATYGTCRRLFYIIVYVVMVHSLLLAVTRRNVRACVRDMAHSLFHTFLLLRVRSCVPWVRGMDHSRPWCRLSKLVHMLFAVRLKTDSISFHSTLFHFHTRIVAVYARYFRLFVDLSNTHAPNLFYRPGTIILCELVGLFLKANQAILRLAQKQPKLNQVLQCIYRSNRWEIGQ